MAIKTRKQALSCIKERVHEVDGSNYTCYDAYLGINELTGKPVRLYANSKKELTEKIEAFYRQRSVAGDFASELTAAQIIDAKAALQELREARLVISLAECARREVARFRAVSVCDKTVGSAYAEFLSTKKEGADKDKTMSTTGRWVLHFGEDSLLSSVSAKGILEYLKTHYGAKKPKTYNSHLSYLGTFFNWCMAKTQRYMTENPTADIEQKPIEWEEPEFMSTEACARLLAALWERRDSNPDCLALTVNGLMMGIRREESLRMAVDRTAISVNLDDETVRVAKPKGYTKGIMPRSFQMPHMAVVWAKSFDYLAGVARISEQTTKTIALIGAKAGIDIPKNGYRHTFITKHVAAYGDPAKTQAIVGTSAQMRANNYCGLDSRKEGEAFFAITPSTCQPRAT